MAEKVDLRPSPSISATEFTVGTRRRGNDGTFYRVVENVNGVRRWQKIRTDIDPSVRRKKDKPELSPIITHLKGKDPIYRDLTIERQSIFAIN